MERMNKQKINKHTKEKEEINKEREKKSKQARA